MCWEVRGRGGGGGGSCLDGHEAVLEEGVQHGADITGAQHCDLLDVVDLQVLVFQQQPEDTMAGVREALL